QPAPRRPSAAEADTRHDLVVIGASAGGVEALLALVRDLPGDFQAPVLVVLHVLSSGTSLLPQLLDRAGPLPAVAASANQELAPGNRAGGRGRSRPRLDGGLGGAGRGPARRPHRERRRRHRAHVPGLRRRPLAGPRGQPRAAAVPRGAHLLAREPAVLPGRLP